jgi:hypothetical protein
MSTDYNWKEAKANLPRIKELVDAGVTIMLRRRNKIGSPYFSRIFKNGEKYCRPPRLEAEIEAIIWEGWEFLDPAPVNVGDEEIHFVSLDESNRHDWNDLRFKSEWQDGFSEGAKWMRGKRA